MRELKFRAWHKKRKKYYNVLHLHIKTITNGGAWATCEGFDIIEQKEMQIQVQPECCVIEEFTGLNDKNGKEIYEGDIVENYNGKRAVVKWAKFGGEVGFYPSDYPNGTTPDLSMLRVVGNIHETPELLQAN